MLTRSGKLTCAMKHAKLCNFNRQELTYDGDSIEALLLAFADDPIACDLALRLVMSVANLLQLAQQRLDSADAVVAEHGRARTARLVLEGVLAYKWQVQPAKPVIAVRRLGGTCDVREQKTLWVKHGVARLRGAPLSSP